jgi:glycerol-3-phosphate dehydrogenase subunit B
VRGRIVSVTFDGSSRGWLETGDALDEVDAVVLATGGLLGGGLLYSPIASVLASEPRAAGGPLVRATLDAPLVIGVGGAPLEPPSSLFGGAPETHAWPYVDPSLLERAGVLLGDPGHVRGAPTGLFAAGEVVADRPRTWLDALSSGVAAGSAAAR